MPWVLPAWDLIPWRARVRSLLAFLPSVGTSLGPVGRVLPSVGPCMPWGVYMAVSACRGRVALPVGVLYAVGRVLRLPWACCVFRSARGLPWVYSVSMGGACRLPWAYCVQGWRVLSVSCPGSARRLSVAYCPGSARRLL